MKLESYTANLYQNNIEEIRNNFSYKNPIEIPKLNKISVNVGIKATENDVKRVDYIQRQLAIITGQNPVIIKSTKSISSFKLREGVPIGCMVTLRKKKMYNFLDKMLLVGLPRTRDFRGFSVKSFNQKGHYSFGIKEHTIFLEVDFTNSFKPFGMNINIVTTAKTKKEALFLLKKIKLPIK
ncbi:50S ribosomal protein L5 [Flavobacteriaceae bacterium]|nr:50S ribosomal protein L5 [Flavobacteriaceae bacterium]